MQQKIAYLDPGKVLTESVIGKQEQARQQKVHDILLQAGKDAEARYAEMTPEQKQKSALADQTILNNQWQAEQRHAREISMKTIAAAVEAYRVNHKIDVVLSQNQVIAIDSRSNITKDIIDELKKIHVDYGSLPVITIKQEESKDAVANKKVEKPTPQGSDK